MKLEVGMYVRTTYGIGKIVNAYIVYDDSGCLWHLSYMTDNPEIEVSIYTKNNSWELFGEVQKDHRIKYEPLENNFDLVKKVYEQELEEIVCYVPENKNYPRNASLYDDHKFIKASYNIIDLIKSKDIILGRDGKIYQCWKIYKDYVFTYSKNKQGQTITLVDYQIDNILTKEQFEQKAYKVED